MCPALPDIPLWARDVLRSGYIFNNGHLLVDLQLQVKKKKKKKMTLKLTPSQQEH